MSTSPAEMGFDLGAAAYTRLTLWPAFNEVVAEGLVGTDPDGTPWVFQGLNDEGAPFRDPEGTGTGVIVLTVGREEWASNVHNTNRFPVLQVLYYMDATRNEDGSPVARDAEAKCRQLAHRLDRAFHIFGDKDDPYRTEHFWPYSDLSVEPSKAMKVMVHYSRRSSGLSIRDVPGSGSLTVRGEQRYELSTD